MRAVHAHPSRRTAGPAALAALVLAVGLTIACAAPARAEDGSGADVSVQHARLRWLPGDLPLAGYFELHNRGQRPLRLVGAASTAFGRVMLHRSTHAKGVEHMEHVKSVEVAPGKTLRFAPGGYHLMLMKRRHTIKVGDRIPITLRFADGHRQRVEFRVQAAGTQ